MDDPPLPPTEDELKSAIAKLKSDKAPGQYGILPEMIKAACCKSDFLGLLLDLMHTLWRESKVPRDWVNAVLIPIPQKGDLHNYDNWRDSTALCSREGYGTDPSGKASGSGRGSPA